MNDVSTIAAEATRDANDRIAAKARRLHFTARVPFLCECGNPRCRELVLLRVDDHDAARREGGGAILLAGHATAGEGAVDELEQTG